MDPHPGVSLNDLGDIQRECGQADCISSYVEAAEMANRAGDRAGLAAVALNLTQAHIALPAVRDLEEAERWCRHSLEMYGQEQRHGRAQCLGLLGLVAHERFKEARAGKWPRAKLVEYLDAARRAYREALALLPSDAVDDLSVTHNQLGNVCRSAGDVDGAVSHYQNAIRYDEKRGDLYSAALNRKNATLALIDIGRLGDARAYALAALRNYETYGDRAADEIEQTQRLLAQIDQTLATTRPS